MLSQDLKSGEETPQRQRTGLRQREIASGENGRGNSGSSVGDDFDEEDSSKEHHDGSKESPASLLTREGIMKMGVSGDSDEISSDDFENGAQATVGHGHVRKIVG